MSKNSNTLSSFSLSIVYCIFFQLYIVFYHAEHSRSFENFQHSQNLGSVRGYHQHNDKTILYLLVAANIKHRLLLFSNT